MEYTRSPKIAVNVKTQKVIKKKRLLGVFLFALIFYLTTG